jgi:hypothetical protein
MGAWYIDGIRFNSNYTRHQDEIVNASGIWDDPMGFGRASLQGCRVHGNTEFEWSNIAWQDSPARMRDQDAVYRAAINAADDTFAYKEIFDGMPDSWDASGGFHIIDIDDPMLLERGEAYIHKQFTDYMAETISRPEESSDEWDKLCRSYIFKNFFLNLSSGVVPAAIVVEPVRQLFGLPYEWHGAPIE